MEKVPYGFWKSPITSRSMANTIKFDGLKWDQTSKTLLWYEVRAGRGHIVGHNLDFVRKDITERPVRAQIGYGGGHFTVHAGWLYFIDAKTAQVIKQPIKEGC
jgi:hypothetical protein